MSHVSVQLFANIYDQNDLNLNFGRMKEEETHAILKNLPKLEKVGKFEELRCHLVSEGAFPKELLDRVLVSCSASDL